MTAPKHIDAPRYANAGLCRVGMMPRSDVLDALRASLQHKRAWARNQYLASYVGEPDAATNGNLASVFYPITCFPYLYPTNTAYLGGNVCCYAFNTGTAAVTQTLAWYAGIADGSPTTTIFSRDYQNDTSDEYDEPPSGGSYQLGYLTVTPSASNNRFVASKLVATNMLVAGIGLWSLPQKTLTDAYNLYLTASTFAPGETIRGYDSNYGTSLGAILHCLHNSTTNLSLWHHTRRCMFQTIYPTGAYTVAGELGMDWTEIRSSATSALVGEYKAIPRNLRGSAENICTLPALVITASAADCAVRLRSATAGDAWTFTAAGALTNVLVDPTDGAGDTLVSGLLVAPTGDRIIVEVDCPSGESIVVHTVSLWEWHTPDELESENL